MKQFIFAVLLTLTAQLFGQVSSIACYDCRADDSTCNVGECHGVTCVKMETANLDNERRTVHKSCSDEYEETQCKQSTFGSKMIIRCTCDSEAYCNGEDALAAAGLLSSPASMNLPVFVLIPVLISLLTLRR